MLYSNLHYNSSPPKCLVNNMNTYLRSKHNPAAPNLSYEIDLWFLWLTACTTFYGNILLRGPVMGSTEVSRVATSILCQTQGGSTVRYTIAHYTYIDGIRPLKVDSQFIIGQFCKLQGGW